VTSVLMSISGPVHVAATDQAKTVVVIDDDVVIDGTVTEQLVVISGTATINGTVKGNVVAIDSDLVLNDGARVGLDVNLYRSNIVQNGTTEIGGTLHERGNPGFPWGFMWAFWLAMTVVVLAAGLLFAAFGGRQLTGAAGYIAHRPAETVVATILGAILLPALAVFAIVTVIGIPLGLAVFLFLMPALWFLGYVVAGTAVGKGILTLLGQDTATEHPYLAAVVGLLLLQVVSWVPFFGWLVGIVAAAVGAGALVYRAWTGLRGTAAPRMTTTAPAAM
jgi:hypothetical protein